MPKSHAVRDFFRPLQPLVHRPIFSKDKNCKSSQRLDDADHFVLQFVRHIATRWQADAAFKKSGVNALSMIGSPSVKRLQMHWFPQRPSSRFTFYWIETRPLHGQSNPNFVTLTASNESADNDFNVEKQRLKRNVLSIPTGK